MKKFLIALIVCTLVFPLSGCGKKSEKDIQAQTIDKMYTDNNKLVLAVGDIYKLVYYHDKDGKITGLEHYYEYKDEKTANEKCEQDKESLKNNASIVSSNNKPSIPDGITAIITLIHKSIVSLF